MPLLPDGPELHPVRIQVDRYGARSRVQRNIFQSAQAHIFVIGWRCRIQHASGCMHGSGKIAGFDADVYRIG